MTNTAEMTNNELQAQLAEAVEWSNWHFDDQNWHMAERWHLIALRAQLELERRASATRETA